MGQPPETTASIAAAPEGDNTGGPSKLTGLTAAEVAERVAQGLVNTIPNAPTRTTRQIVRSNVLTPVNLIVAILAGLVIAARSPKNALFGFVIVANSIIGIVQELRAKKSLDSLRVISAPRASVIRDGKTIELQVHELVQDDVVALRAGQQIVADGVVLAHDNLEVDESLLTGEADPVVKTDDDELLSGSAVVAGTGCMRVTKVGAENYAAKLAEEAKRFTLVNSKLRNDVNLIVTWVGYAMIPVGILLATSQFWRHSQGWREAIIQTVAGLIGMVPEGLVLLTSVAFAVGVVRLAKRRCLVQELPAIEVLARVDVLCADKTGTITEGTLSLAELVPVGDGEAHQIDDVLRAMADLDPDPNATLTAVRTYYQETPTPDAAGWTATGRVPFSSARKWSAMSFGDNGSWVLGAPENVLTDAYQGELRDDVETQAAAGRRVLVLARADGTFGAGTGGTSAADGGDAGTEAAVTGEPALPPVQAIALVLLEDIVRHDAAETLAYFTEQGVTVKVISGDNPVTVAAVAKRAGLAGWADNIDAKTLPDESDLDALADALDANTVFGRVTPHQKRAMVRALQHRGHVVAMTGDGVNDVLALKDADCGVAMASGSEAARGVAQLVLMDSNFSALPSVVAEGRRVINNIERVASLFLTKTCYSIVLSVLTGVLALDYPLRPIHLTLLSWFTIGVPAFFLALEPNADRVNEGFLGRVLGWAVPAGAVIALMTMAVFEIVQLNHSIDAAHARSVAVMVAGAVALMNLYRVARPLNPLRAVLVTAMGAMFALAFVIPRGRTLFELPTTESAAYLVAAIAITASYPLLVLGNWVSHQLYRETPRARSQHRADTNLG
ncbi:MAG: cation-translocating P-type ATPase [Ilumatobacteraceae bacterium]